MLTREVLNADEMALTIYVGGQSYVGIGVTFNGVGTVYFEFSTNENPNEFYPLSCTPFPSGTAVSSITASGNYLFALAPNIGLVRARFDRTSGSVKAIIGASVDQSYQDAFLAASDIANSSQVSSGNNTLTQAAQANRAWNLTFCEVSIMAGSYPGCRVDIYDGAVGGTKLFSEFLTAAVGSVGTVQKLNLPLGKDGNPSLVNTPGNAMTIQVTGITGASVINTNFSAA